ncbi:aminoacyl-tRNA hydrolase [Asticcacaulis tiandongensis]|uniref:aminoacyl-tRNA hydrolase n=1 Tax=Asticcacaulis tiandongensis TaxID=2565365 RepID=UPI0011263B03|nr:aminoacyl-tRNA hydrolase [Asticcacaulis tiandongensis]
MYLIVGLGNPGGQYAKNRHNIGFMFIDELIRSSGFGPERNKFQSVMSEGTVQTAKGPVKALALKPQTYMNLSGNAVKEAAAFYKIDPDHIIVYHDELDLAPGRLRMKLGGGHAGHNGLRSIMSHLGPNFVRARMGIGHPGQKELVHSWVLSDFYKADTWVERLNDAAVSALPLLLAGETEKYQTEVMRLAPAPKLDPKQANPQP